MLNLTGYSAESPINLVTETLLVQNFVAGDIQLIISRYMINKKLVFGNIEGMTFLVSDEREFGSYFIDENGFLREAADAPGFSITINSGSDAKFILPLRYGAGTAHHDLIINWGDGIIDTITGTAGITAQYEGLTHDYLLASAEYTIKITGTTYLTTAENNSYYGLGFHANIIGYNVNANKAKIISASGSPDNLLSDSMPSKNYCYQFIFFNCTSLTTAPELPTTILANNCYGGMFSHCTSLVAAPELPATTLTECCYQSMFSHCTSLVAVPELPATTLTAGCYEDMFQDCTSLMTAPILPATNLNEACYAYMFNSCTSLTTAPELPATTLTDYCYAGMFCDCVSLITAPELPATTLATYCYESMFADCTSLITAPELSVTTLFDYCYAYMFYGCTSLVNASELPAIILAEDCYNNMFSSCTSLINAPVLPATTLADYCYAGMFQSCASLINAPELPATTLFNYCYSFMFDGCTSLVNTPVLNATTLATYCYQYMFYSCLALNNSIIKIAAVPSDISWARNMFNLYAGRTLYLDTDQATFDAYNVSSVKGSTTLKRLGLNITINSGSDSKFILPLKYGSGTAQHELIIDWGDSNIQTITGTADITAQYKGLTHDYPLINTEYTIKISGTTRLTTAENSSYYGLGFYSNTTGYNAVTNKSKVIAVFGSPDNLLSGSISNKQYCYSYMFYGCTSLTNTPILSATTLASNCYSYMFYGCTSLTNTPILSATTLASNCYSYMFSDCTSLISTPALPATTLAQSCYYSMFQSCTSLTAAPALPATALASSCYSYMFSGCTTLISAPILPATALAFSCYSAMFYNCTSLISAPVLPVTTLAESCYYSMFQSCTSLITAPKLPATTLATSCYRQMFLGCTSLINTPELPATTLTSYCYNDMFYDCTSLTTAPELPATTLATQCYQYMFNGCTSLTIAPTLPATSFASNCYTYMFQNCISLNGSTIKIAAAPSTISWASNMFNLKTANPKATLYLMTTQAVFNAYNVAGVKGSYTDLVVDLPYLSITINSGSDSKFILPLRYGGSIGYIDPNYNNLVINWGDGSSNQTVTTYPTSYQGITHTYSAANTEYTIKITGTTRLYTAENSSYYGLGFSSNTTGYNAQANKNKVLAVSGSPDNLLSASMTNKDYCYRNMFYGCTSLTTISLDFLPTTTLATNCYFQMFYDCTSLAAAPALPATILATNCYYQMFYNCTSLTAAPVLPATTLTTSCYYYMFQGCRSLITAPELPATTLATQCYSSMFNSCTSLTTAPELPATTLANYCYSYMFYGCTSLINAPVLPATTLANYCYSYMFYNCTSLTTAPTLPATTLVSNCYSYMFYGCTSLNGKTITIAAAPTLANISWVANMFNLKTSGPNVTLYIETTQTIFNAYNVDSVKGNYTDLIRARNETSFSITINSGEDSKFILPLRYGEGTAHHDLTINWGDGTINTVTGTAGITAADEGLTHNYSLTNTEYTIELIGTTYLTTAENYSYYGFGFFENNYTGYNVVTNKSKVIAASGSPDNLLSDSMPSKDYCYYKMFLDCTSLVTAPELPATILTDYCYSYMFNGCTSLVNAPELFATTLANQCYGRMFQYCTSLINAPELPATILTNGCYIGMFEGCSSLINAPALPATILTEYCYGNMFKDCTSLVTAPALPATTLASGCYETMFATCTSLKYINIATAPSSIYWAYYMLYLGADTTLYLETDQTTFDAYDVTSVKGSTTLIRINSFSLTINSGSDSKFILPLKYGSGTAHHDLIINWGDSNTQTVSGTARITAQYEGLIHYYPLTNTEYTIKLTGATYLTTAESNSYYGFGFYSGSNGYNVAANKAKVISVSGSPDSLLSASMSNKNYCYSYMFYGCTSLTTAPTLPETTLATYCYQSMFNGCLSLTTVPVLSATTLANYCYNSMFYGCASLVNAPELPATALASNCYTGMFYNCTSLVTAPILPATTLASSCYYQMFQGCTSLIMAPILPATALTTSCYYQMLRGCTSLVTAPELFATSLATQCYYGMFYGCTSLTVAPALPATTLANSCYIYMFNGCTSLEGKTITVAAAPTLANISWIANMFNLKSSAPAIDLYLDTTEAAFDIYNVASVKGDYTNLIKDMSYFSLTINSGSDAKFILPLKYGSGTAHHDLTIYWGDNVKEIITGTAGITEQYKGLIHNYPLADTEYTIKLKGTTWLETRENESYYGLGFYDVSNGYNATANKIKVISVSGSPDNLLSASMSSKNYCYYYMFKDCTSLINAPKLPATILAIGCYLRMFENCPSLTAAPALPATTLAVECYCNMFSRCTSLLNAPELPATILADGCYADMFSNCTALTTAPELPATTLAYYCYKSMFYDCTNLTIAPALPATILTDTCYQSMFNSCTSLTTAPALPATTLSNYCYVAMFIGCPLTTAPALPATTLAERCYFNMFHSCTSLINAPELPATTLAYECYYGMFQFCTSLISAPELPATILFYGCYVNMFQNCTSLNGKTIKIAAAPSTISWTSNMFNLKSSGPAIDLYLDTDQTTFDAYNVTSVKGNYTNLIKEPPYFKITINSGSNSKFILPLKYGSGTAHHDLRIDWGDSNIQIITDQAGITAQYQGLTHDYSAANTLYTIKIIGTTYLTTMEDNSYYGLGFYYDAYTNNFYDNAVGYNALVNKAKVIAASGSPDNLLSASMINKSSCYSYMFSDCTSLITAPALPATTLANECYWGMFYGCTSLINVPALPATTLTNGCYTWMFVGCTSLVTAPALPATTLTFQCYGAMFSDCTSLITAPALPATILDSQCYQYMFYGCTSLTTAPALPTTTLAIQCYTQMFYNCTSLITAPELPAITLATYCYTGMFWGCTSLATTPALPATTLVSGCYGQMFQNCISLNGKTIKIAAAPTLANISWAADMFNLKTSTPNATLYLDTTQTVFNAYNVASVKGSYTDLIKYVPHFSLTINSGSDAKFILPLKYGSGTAHHDLTIDWGDGTIQIITGTAGITAQYQGLTHNYPLVSAEYTIKITGTTYLTTSENSSYYGLGFYSGSTGYNAVANKFKVISASGSPDNLLSNSMSSKNYCYFYMFRDCTSLTVAPELPATILTSYCYYGMFQGCSSLLNAPKLNATTLADFCYYSMFYDCSSLTAAPILPATTLITYCYSNMFYNCSSLTTAPTLPATTLATYCYQGMFYGCTSLTAAPALPATILANNCYYQMFYNCTSLTAAPILPVTTLAEGCYYSMFYNCTSLTAAPILPATTLASSCYGNMFQGCTSLITAPELPATTLANWCYSSIFRDCISLTAAPELPATTLTAGCYGNMFYGCTSLTVAPAILPATTLTQQCYVNMFYNCTSLTAAPELPATTLIDNCYQGMFQNCTSLNGKIITIAAAPSTISWAGNMFNLKTSSYPKAELYLDTDQATFDAYNVTSVKSYYTDLIKEPPYFKITINSGSDSKFILPLKYGSGTAHHDLIINWGDGVIDTVTDTAGITAQYQGLTHIYTLSNTLYTIKISGTTYLITAENQSYYGFGFSNNTTGYNTDTNKSKIIAFFRSPDNLLSSSMTIKDYCYAYMFYGCTALTTAPALPATTLASNCYYSMFYNCTSLINAPVLPATNLIYYCYADMFQNCTSLVTAPVLPAITLVSGCYYQMFQNCTSLINAPELPATTLVNNCYYGMFKGCTSLNSKIITITTAPSNISWAEDMFNLKVSGPVIDLYLDTDQTTFDAYNVTSVKSYYTNLIKEPSYFSLTINSGSDSKFILPLKYGAGTAHHDLTINWGDGVIDTVTGTAGITAQYQGLTHSYPLVSTNYKIKMTGTTWLTTAENQSYYGLGFFDNSTGYNADTNKIKVISSSGSPDALLSDSMSSKDYCYRYMFMNCRSLITAPALPATTLATYCYYGMFYGCSSLITAPILPATTLATYCYYYMFMSCISLTTAPALPATTLANYCYGAMFYYCTKLTVAPELPATILAECCYNYMFYSCISLNNKTITIAAAPSDISWVREMLNLVTINPYLYLDTDQIIFDIYNVTSVKGLTTLIKAPLFKITINSGSDAKFILPLKYGEGTAHHELTIDWGDKNIQTVTGTAGITAQYQGLTHDYPLASANYTIKILGTTWLETAENQSYYGLGFYYNSTPTGYNVDTNKIKVISSSGSPDNLLSDSMSSKYYCYRYMFYGCSSLTAAPELPATTLAECCYYGMFTGCSSLMAAPILPATTLAPYCYYSMFSGCTSLINAPELPVTTITNYCYMYMFTGCTSLVNAPELPATTLTGSCYQSMFYGCTSLIGAPELPATILNYYCYVNMFAGCTSLNNKTIKIAAAPTLANISWVLNMFNLKSSSPAIDLYLDTDQTIFDIYNVASVKGDYTNLIKEILCFKITINSGSDAKFILPLKYGYGTAHHDLTIDWGDGNIQSVTGTAGITAQYQGLTRNYNLANTKYTIKLVGTTYLTTAENSSYYGLGFYDSSTGYNAAANKNKVISSSGSPDNLLSNSMPSKDFCYRYMFMGCTYLKNAPELLATTLAIYCYYSMFRGCTSLTTAPELPATTLDTNCYYAMFHSCTSLTTAPTLPATTLTTYCYAYMFAGCTSLVVVPELPVTTLAAHCYDSMFNGCRSLINAPALPATTVDTYCYYFMFTGCTSLVTAPELPATTLFAECYSYMFYGCTSLISAPSILPATTLATNCYYQMFYNCTSLINVPSILPATTLASQCYYYMFYNCTSLTTAPELPATTLNYYCYYYMFYGCTSLINAPSILPATTLINSCYAQMFYGCTSLITAPALPATTLDTNCYYQMFYSCTSLINVPSILPATTLATQCYVSMFQNCSSLINAPELPATTLDNNCYQSMFYGCTSLTVAPELPATTLASNCYSYMFQNCISLNGKTITIAAAPSTISWANNMFNLKSLSPVVNLYLDTDQTTFDTYNVTSVKGNYTNLIKT